MISWNLDPSADGNRLRAWRGSWELVAYTDGRWFVGYRARRELLHGPRGGRVAAVIAWLMLRMLAWRGWLAERTA